MKSFYNNAKIYKIVDNKSNMIYFGSTCKKLSQRLANHTTNYRKYLNCNKQKGYLKCFDIFDNNDYSIILVETFPCNNMEQLKKQERTYIESVDCLNRNMKIIIKKEIIKDDKEENKKNSLKEYNRNYYNKCKLLKLEKSNETNIL